jgi:hypothetical protein
MQIVSPRSKKHRLLCEAALVLGIEALVMQSSVAWKANGMNVRDPSKMKDFIASNFRKWRGAIECDTIIASAIECTE